MKASKLPSADETDFTENGVTAWQINKLLKFDWLETDSNLIITGKCNSGKTALASRIGREAIKQRHKVYYIMTENFLEVIQTKLTSPRSQKIFSYIKECRLLIIDEVLYLPLTAEELQIFYKAVVFLNATQSIIFITNRELSDWRNACDDQHLMQTLLDRIAAEAQILRLEKSIIPPHKNPPKTRKKTTK